MKVVLLLLLPLLSLAVRTKTRQLGDKCGKKKNCEEGTSCKQWKNKAGKARGLFCLLEDCLEDGEPTNEGRLKFGVCCSGLKMKGSQCVEGSGQETPDNNSEEEQVPTPPKSYNEEFCTKTPDHTMCLYQGVGSACPDGSEFGFTDAGKKLIVDKHNELRSKVARGEEGGSAGVGGQPKAANMRALRWSEELAEVAQRWADQCTSDPMHDENRKKLDGTPVGQNAFIGFANKKTQDEVMATMDEPVQFWYDEVINFDSENVDPFKFSEKAGHYTQVSWADTEEVGCGWSHYMEDGWWKSMVQCNYAIGGNMAGSAMYKMGEPCSSCPADYTCTSDKLCQAPAE